MTLFKNMVFSLPFIRVNNKDKNSAFYRETLGFNLHSEENGLALFSSKEDQTIKFIIEESPSMRTRRVRDGKKKLKQIVVKCHQAADIENLLAKGVDYDKLYRGENGFAFEATSPEQDHFLLHAEDDLSTLVEIETADFQSHTEDWGLSDFVIQEIVLRVPSKDAQDFYQDLFGDALPLNLSFVVEEGCDLQVEPNVTWDLEVLEFKVNPDTDLSQLKTYFEAKGLEVYLDRAEKILVISDLSRIELWFVK